VESEEVEIICHTFARWLCQRVCFKKLLDLLTEIIIVRRKKRAEILKKKMMKGG